MSDFMEEITQYTHNSHQREPHINKSPSAESENALRKLMN